MNKPRAAIQLSLERPDESCSASLAGNVVYTACKKATNPSLLLPLVRETQKWNNQCFTEVVVGPSTAVESWQTNENEALPIFSTQKKTMKIRQTALRKSKKK